MSKSPKESDNAGPSEDTKRKFREALERKHAHGGKNVADDGERSKVHGAHGPETSATQQMFRRKSGG
jgi:Family of unknown function (DUF5302)